MLSAKRLLVPVSSRWSIKSTKAPSKFYYRQKGTSTELAEATVDNNEGQEYEVSFVNTFHAKDIAGYRPVKASLEARIQQKGVNEVVFEYEPITDTTNPATPNSSSCSSRR